MLARLHVWYRPNQRSRSTELRDEKEVPAEMGVLMGVVFRLSTLDPRRLGAQPEQWSDVEVDDASVAAFVGCRTVCKCWPGGFVLSG